MVKTDDTMRLNRFLARAGLGSRRAVEDLIRQGKVTIEGKVVSDLGRQVNPHSNQVAVDGVPVVLPTDFRIYAFHKPLGVVSTLKSQKGQPSLLPFRLQSDIADRFVPIGRLDSESTGLLLWTDDGRLNQDLARPSGGIWKTYEVELSEPLADNLIPKLTQGEIHIDGRACLPCRLEMEKDKTTRHWIMELHEGRRRQIRRMFKKVGIKVLKLHRTQIGPVSLGKLRPGDFRRLTPREEAQLREAVAPEKGRTR